MNDATKAPELLPCPFCGATMDDWHGQSFTHPLVERQEDACILAGLSFSYQHSRWGTQEIIRWNRRATPTALAASPEVAALIETTLAALQDPLVVHLNMVAGKIAKPLPSQLVHIYGEDVLRSAFAALIWEAEAWGMDRAARIIDDMPQNEGDDFAGRIRAEAAALRGEKEPK